jgi:hypothetical protein
MKQYKHKSGMVVTLHSNDLYETEPSSFSFPKKIVENSNDWQEITKPEYTILSLKYIKFTGWLHDFKKNQIVEARLDENGIYSFKYKTGWDKYTQSGWENLLFKEVFNIHSVRRESDSSIWTINDILQDKSCGDSPITKITLDGDGLLFHTRYGAATINQLTKGKKALFITEDLKEVFEGDNLYYVKFKEKRNTVGKPFEVISCSFPGCIYEPEYEKYFSSKENAEKFIMYHKPCLTLNEVLSIYKKTYETSQVLKDFVKQKLKQ